MVWNNSNVALLVTVMMAVSSGLTGVVQWGVLQEQHSGEIERLQLLAREDSLTQTRDYLSRIDVIINEHERDLIDVNGTLKQIQLEIESINKHLGR